MVCTLAVNMKKNSTNKLTTIHFRGWDCNVLRNIASHTATHFCVEVDFTSDSNHGCIQAQMWVHLIDFSVYVLCLECCLKDFCTHHACREEPGTTLTQAFGYTIISYAWWLCHYVWPLCFSFMTAPLYSVTCQTWNHWCPYQRHLILSAAFLSGHSEAFFF